MKICGDAKLTGEQARSLDQAELDHLPCIRENMDAAITQAHQYAEALRQKYTELRLKSFAVVVLGFDRISWQYSVINYQP